MVEILAKVGVDVDVDRFVVQLVKESGEVTRREYLEGLVDIVDIIADVLVSGTRVKTGQARGSWVFTVADAPVTPPQLDPGGARTIANLKIAARDFRDFYTGRGLGLQGAGGSRVDLEAILAPIPEVGITSVDRPQKIEFLESLDHMVAAAVAAAAEYRRR